ncbi:hypothetical protein MHYP_G00304520 [Metynnis hypsauchen]
MTAWVVVCGRHWEEPVKVDGGCREGEQDRPEGTLKSMVGDLEIEAGSQRHCGMVLRYLKSISGEAMSNVPRRKLLHSLGSLLKLRYKRLTLHILPKTGGGSDP